MKASRLTAWAYRDGNQTRLVWGTAGDGQKVRQHLSDLQADGIQLDCFCIRLPRRCVVGVWGRVYLSQKISQVALTERISFSEHRNLAIC